MHMNAFLKEKSIYMPLRVHMQLRLLIISFIKIQFTCPMSHLIIDHYAQVMSVIMAECELIRL